MHPKTAELLDQIEASTEELEALRTACEQAPPLPTTRLAMGHLVLDHVATLDAAVAASARAHLDGVGGRFSEMGYDLPAALLSWLVTRLDHPDAGPASAPLAERTNHLMARALVAQREAPLVQTFVRACDGDWDAFANDYDALRRVFSSGAGREPRRTPRSLSLRLDGDHVPAICYVLAGTLEGLLGAFGRQGTAELHRDDTGADVTLRW